MRPEERLPNQYVMIRSLIGLHIYSSCYQLSASLRRLVRLGRLYCPKAPTFVWRPRRTSSVTAQNELHRDLSTELARIIGEFWTYLTQFKYLASDGEGELPQWHIWSFQRTHTSNCIVSRSLLHYSTRDDDCWRAEENTRP